MKRILLILVLFCTTIAFSQQKTFEKEVAKISKEIDRITKEEKDSLKIKVKAINVRLDKKEITLDEAKQLKQTAAIYHSKRIEDRVGAEEKKLQQLVQDKTNGKIASSEETKKRDDFFSDDEDDENDDENTFTIGNRTYRFSVDKERARNRVRRIERRWKRKNKRGRSTTTQFVFAMGVNNVLVNDELSSLDNSNYKFWQSHFYELGFTWKTRFSKRASKLYLKYGASFLWNNLRATENRYHVVNGDVTDLQTHPDVLLESRLRHVQMTFPVHVEWDFSRNGTYSDGEPRDRTNRSIRIGVGAFAGFKMGTRQYLEFQNAQGTKVEEVQKGDFNMNRLNYGLSAYFAYQGIGAYVKYDLNPLFRNTEVRNISMGVRFDIN